MRAAFAPLRCRHLFYITLLGLAASALPAALRAADETGASAVRTWRDASGNFELEATLVERTGSQVKLKRADGRVSSIPLEKLSKADQQYIRSLGDSNAAAVKPAEPPKFPKPDAAPAEQGATLPDSGQIILIRAGEAPTGVAPNPAAHLTPLPEGAIPLDKFDAYDKVTAPLVLDPQGAVVAMSVARNMSGKPEETRGRIYIGKFPRGPAKLAWDTKEAAELLDHHVESGRTLAMVGLDQFQRGGEVVLFEGLADGQPKELYRRKLTGIEKPGFKPKIEWGALLDADHMAAVIQDHLYVWNIPTATLLYQTERMSGLKPTLSPGRRYLALPMTGGAAIIDVVDGSQLGYIACGESHTPGTAFDLAGRKIALTWSNQYLVFDLHAGEVAAEHAITQHLHNKPLGWPADDLLLSGSGDLIHTGLGMSAWNYYFPLAEARCVAGSLLLTSKRDVGSLVSLRVPHRAATDAIAKLQKGADGMLLVRPGDKVSMFVETIQEVPPEQVEDALKENIERAGWKFVPESKIVVAAVIGRDKPVEIEYRQRSRDGAESTEKVTVTPFTARLEIRSDGQVLWTRETRNYPPSFLILHAGESLQDAVKKYERPDAQFFSRMQIPPRVPKPEVAAGLGRSTLEAFSWKDGKPLGELLKQPRGIPPGRRASDRRT